jgi:hypothetical protein
MSQQPVKVKPSTPVVVQFEGGKKLTLHADILARVFPKFADQIKALVASPDKADKNKMRAALDLTAAGNISRLTLEEGIKLMSYSCDGPFDPTTYFLLKRLGLPIPDNFVLSHSLPRVPLQIKGTSSHGSLVALTLVGAQDSYFTATSCRCAKTFGNAFPGMPDGRYITGTQTILLGSGNKFTVQRAGDMAHTFVMKVQLSGPTDLDTLFESMNMQVGPNITVEMDLQTNNALARAHGLWPSKNNDAQRQPKQSWVATIPIMMRETTAYTKLAKPLVALYYNECCFNIKNIKNEHAVFALDVDYVYLDTEARRWMANRGCGRDPTTATTEEKTSAAEESWDAKAEWDSRADLKDDSSKKAAADDKSAALRTSTGNPLAFSGETGHLFFVEQFQTRKEHLSLAHSGSSINIRLDMSHPTSGMLITLSPEEMEMKQLFNAPIVSASLSFNGNCAMEYDFADLTEWNWIKCGMRAPTDFSTLLLPFSREMFAADKKDDVVVCPCTVNLSRLDSIVLTLNFNKEAFELCDWNAGITAVSTNVSRVITGEEHLKFCA